MNPPGRRCRGWGLVSRRGLTGAEREAGAAHLDLCRRCRDHLVLLDRTRAQLLGGSAGLVGGLATTTLVSGGSSTLAAGGVAAAKIAGGAAASKIVAGLVAAAGGLVLAAAATAAVVQQPSHDAPVTPLQVGSVVQRPSPTPSCRTCSPAPGPSSLLGVIVPEGSSVPVDVPPLLPTATPTTVVPTLPAPLPTLPFPTLPVPLPTLPVPLPTLP